MGVSWQKFHGKSFKKRFLNTSILLLFFCFSGVFCDDLTTASVPLGFEVNAFNSSSILVSENGVFSFGFLEIDGVNGDGYVVGIKYYNLGDKSVNLPVWTVGGGLKVPVTSTFRVTTDGRLILMNNISRVTIWSSNTSSLGVQKASLLDNGNLVLLGSKDEVVWQSFDNPTNTLLPTQSIQYPKNLRALSTSTILSYYNLVINHVGELALVWEHNVTYWRSPVSCNEARFDSSGVLGLYDDGNKLVWSVSPKDYGDANLRHLRIDRDGNLRIYSWDNVTRAWKAVWQAVEDQCSVFGSCGLYSICGYNSSGPVCDCLFSDSSGISSSGVDSGISGCKKMPDLGNCRMHTSMLVMRQTVLYGLYPSRDVEMSLSETDCKGYCSNDSTCIAATSMNDGSGLCTLKRTTFVSGYSTPYVHAVSFLKVCSVPQAVVTRGNGSISSSDRLTARKGSPKPLIVAIALIVLLTLFVILSIQMLLFWLLYYRRKGKVRGLGKDAQMNPHYSMLIRLSYEEINELTSNFTNQIGTSVFRGVLPNKTPIVAKVLKDVVVSEKEFRIKVSTLSGTHHRNLVSVKGFCFDPGNKCLIYEYVPNGSLDKWLFNPKAHDERVWQRKLNISLGVARGLSYLHSECLKCISHGNLKLENVLLDENMVPKLTDFGLEDLFTKHQASSSSSESPSERDMHMLGEMLLQIVTCKRDVAGENISNILEQEEKFAGDESLETIERIARIAFWCMQDQPFLRPSIGEVVKVLEGTLSVDLPPSRLARRQQDREVSTEIEAEW